MGLADDCRLSVLHALKGFGVNSVMPLLHSLKSQIWFNQMCKLYFRLLSFPSILISAVWFTLLLTISPIPFPSCASNLCFIVKTFKIWILEYAGKWSKQITSLGKVLRFWIFTSDDLILVKSHGGHENFFFSEIWGFHGFRGTYGYKVTTQNMVWIFVLLAMYVDWNSLWRTA
jgi:hypothetical protein